MEGRLKEPDQGGGLHFTKHWAVAFGGIKQGSGDRRSARRSAPSSTNGGYFQVKAVYLDQELPSAPGALRYAAFWDDRAHRHQPGALAGRAEVEPVSRWARFARRRRSITPSGKSEVQHPARAAAHADTSRIGAGFGIERLSHRAPAGSISVGDPALAAAADVPGLGTHPLFAHALFGRSPTTRAPSPDYSRSGRFIEGGLHSYNDLHDGQDAFGRFEAERRSSSCRRTAARASSSCRRAPGCRWRERRALGAVLPDADAGRRRLPARLSRRTASATGTRWCSKAQYRWAVHKMVDLAGFVRERARSRRGRADLDLRRHGARPIGLGVRVAHQDVEPVRLDVAHGREGSGSASASAPGGRRRRSRSGGYGEPAPPSAPR